MAVNENRNALVEEHLPLIGYHVNEMMARVPRHVARDDLASAGALALVRAAEGYDPATGVPFNRYAAIRIRGALVDELRSMDWASRGARTKVRRLAAVTDELTATLGRAPSREQLAEALGVDVAEVDQVRDDASRRVLSIDGYDNAIADILPDRAPDPEEAALNAERLTYLHAAVEALPERLRAVVRGIFFEDRAVTEIAATLGVTQSRVSQLRSEAMSLLKDGMNVHLDPELVETPANPAGVAHRRREAYFSAVREHVESVDVAATARAAATALSSTIGAAAQLGAADGVPAARFAALA